jgi:pimeloyl-ACP methyl ester carboxylesterase
MTDPFRTRLHRLPDSRTLEWLECGDPGGLPVVFFHGYLGSAHQVRLADAVLRARGLRCIAPNRPGIGCSTPHTHADMTGHAADTLDLLSALGIDSFISCAVSAGSGYALACAALDPRRTRAVAIASMMGPMAVGGMLSHMHAWRWAMLTCAGRLPWLSALWAKAVRLWIARRPEEAMEKLCAFNIRLLPEALRDDERMTGILRRDMEALLQESADHRSLYDDLRLSFRWGFDPHAIETRAIFLHGLDDTVVPLDAVVPFVRALPNGELRTHAGNHFLLIDALEEFLGIATEVWQHPDALATSARQADVRMRRSGMGLGRAAMG